MNDALAADFMAPIHAREQRIAALDAEITNKQKELAAIESEAAVARKALNELSEQRSEMQGAVNANRALLSKSQADLANVQAAFETLRKKVQSLPTIARAS